MTPEEIEQLQMAGQAFLLNISTLVCQSVLYGLYLPIFAFGIRALWKRNPWTRYTWILFGFLSVLCLMSSIDLAIMVAFNMNMIRGALVNAEMSLAERIQLADDSARAFFNAQVWLGGGGDGGGLLFIFADAVVIWRACVLWPGNKTVKICLLFLLLANFGSTIVSSTLVTIPFSGESDFIPTPSLTGVMITLTLSLSLATNIIATMLIGYKAYYHRQLMKISMEMRSSKSGAILLFLTESGVAFCILQVIALATLVANTDGITPLDYVAYVWQQITVFAAATYPILVLIIIDSHRSISDSIGGSAGDSGNAQRSNVMGSHLSFAAASGDSSSSGGGIGADSLHGSRVDPLGSAGHPNEGPDRVRDLEKGESLNDGTMLPN